MKKLNERGWGLGAFIAFLVVFFLAIIAVTILSNTMGIGGSHSPNRTVQSEIIIRPNKM